jgi:multicomponent Na+:H+ antiporter subunit D
MIRDNLPVLVVIVPLLSGLFTPFTRGVRGLAWAWVSFVTCVVLALTIALLAQVLHLPDGQSYISYPMGSWTVPWGIEYRVDALNAFVLVIVASISAVVTFAARLSIAVEIPQDRQHMFYAVWLLCITGMLGITVTGDAFNLYVLLEIMSLATYTLVAMGKDRDRRALVASMNYVVLGTIGASFILLGIGYLYMVTGTLNMADMAAQLRLIESHWSQGNLAYQRTIVTAFAFLMTGFAIKLALFPLHSWLPDAYTYAPSPVSALLSATATKVGAYITFRFAFTVLGASFAFRLLPTGVVLLICGIAAVLAGSWVAMRQVNIKRMLAYSSVAQIGYIAMGFGLANAAGLQGSIVHLFNHAVTKGGMFLALAAVSYRTGGTDLRHMRGLGRRMPFTMAAFLVGGFGLIGVPLTSGFISKWYLVSGAIDARSFPSAIAILLGSLLAVGYVWRVVEAVYFQPPDDDVLDVREAPASILIPTWILIGASIWFGIDASLTSRISAAAVRALGVLP